MDSFRKQERPLDSLRAMQHITAKNTKCNHIRSPHGDADEDTMMSGRGMDSERNNFTLGIKKVNLND
jgi:hypothetical protein